MSDFDFDLLRRDAACLEAQGSPFALPGALACRKTLRLLLLRYSAVGLEDRDALQALPTLGGNLAKGLPALDRARYAVRPLRQGYVYLLLKYDGVWQIHPYQVDEQGVLRFHDPARPSLVNRVDAVNAVLDLKNGLTLKVAEPERHEEARLLFSPDPLTPAMQERYRSEPALRNRLQSFNLSRLAHQCVDETDVIDPLGVGGTVADFAARVRSASSTDPAAPRHALAAGLEQQLFPSPAWAGSGLPEHLVAELPREPAVALVLHDPLGITQELNAWRNAGLEKVKVWLEAPGGPARGGKPAPSNERMVLVAKAFTELHQTFSERKVGALLSRRVAAQRAYLEEEGQGMTSGKEWWQDTKEQILRVYEAQERGALEQRARSGEFARQFEQDYLGRVDHQAMLAQLGVLDLMEREAQGIAEGRAADHLVWLQHQHLQEALATYDKESLQSGVCFAHQTGLCVVGMEGSTAGAALLGEWWRADAIEPQNLALRAYVFNQRATAEVWTQVQAKLKALPETGDAWSNLEATLKSMKELATQFNGVDGYLDTVAKHAPVNTAGALAWVGHLGREAVRAGAPNRLDRALHRRLTGYLTASLGQQALALRMEQHVQAANTGAHPGRVGAPMRRTLERGFARNLGLAHGNEFFRLRVAGGLLLLEAALLLLQGRELREKYQQGKFWAEVAAGVLVTGAAGLELLAVGTEQALANVAANSVTGRGAQISLGRYRLWGAGMAAAGGLVSIKFDLEDGLSAKDKANASEGIEAGYQRALSGAYLTRVLATGALIAGQGGTAFAQAGPYFMWLASKTEHAIARGIYLVLTHISGRLFTSRAAMLLLGRMAFIGGWIILIATVALLIMDEGELRKWCDRCCYSLEKERKPYASTTEELQYLLAAFDEVA